ncbi:hypothetical protein DQ04_10131030 [Trypanosoma grayi]|uniref:hypothetical protein n=1 Tax=Trypanosoma grayi TaxID=71804 RepID=UPI0004F4B51E|nr:hypothetical protein DQ04_10131030 [Trypanosoma grayi]KEG07338.1 hypothetical protein DQ04_10131030 [Trypanosoma grayi]
MTRMYGCGSSGGRTTSAGSVFFFSAAGSGGALPRRDALALSLVYDSSTRSKRVLVLLCSGRSFADDSEEESGCGNAIGPPLALTAAAVVLLATGAEAAAAAAASSKDDSARLCNADAIRAVRCSVWKREISPHSTSNCCIDSFRPRCTSICSRNRRSSSRITFRNGTAGLSATCKSLGSAAASSGGDDATPCCSCNNGDDGSRLHGSAVTAATSNGGVPKDGLATACSQRGCMCCGASCRWRCGTGAAASPKSCVKSGVLAALKHVSCRYIPFGIQQEVRKHVLKVSFKEFNMM